MESSPMLLTAPLKGCKGQGNKPSSSAPMPGQIHGMGVSSYWADPISAGTCSPGPHKHIPFYSYENLQSKTKHSPKAREACLGHRDPSLSPFEDSEMKTVYLCFPQKTEKRNCCWDRAPEQKKCLKSEARDRSALPVIT